MKYDPFVPRMAFDGFIGTVTVRRGRKWYGVTESEHEFLAVTRSGRALGLRRVTKRFLMSFDDACDLFEVDKARLERLYDGIRGGDEVTVLEYKDAE